MLKIDSVQRAAARGATGFLDAEGQSILRDQAAANRRNTTLAVRSVLIDLARDDTVEAVRVIRSVFRSKVVRFRLLAMAALSAMKVQQARGAIRSRTTLWSFATREEKSFAKDVLAGRSIGICYTCWKLLRKCNVAAGQWSGTLRELSTLRLEHDHGLGCDHCGIIACLECLGDKASKLKLSHFICTKCNHAPLATIYR